MRLYFAHPVTDYGTKRQADALEVLKLYWREERPSQPLEIENPDQPHHQVGYTAQGMTYFKGVIESCRSLAFMRFPNGAVGAGMAREISWALASNMPVYEVFDGNIYHVADMPTPALTIDQTRALITGIRSALASPQPVAPTGEIAGLRRMSDAHREHAQSAVEHNATLNRLLSIAEARADRLEAEVADLRRKLEEAEQKAERQWEGWVREEVARKAAERKLEDAREALEWQPVETAPKGTIVNVVGRYKHATAGYPRYAALNEEVNEWFEYSKHKPEPLVVWAWRPREEWPDESAAPLPEDTHHG